jgi:hypothetical protein
MLIHLVIFEDEINPYNTPLLRGDVERKRNREVFNLLIKNPPVMLTHDIPL